MPQPAYRLCKNPLAFWAALSDPVWTSAVRIPADFALALAGFVALVIWKAPSCVVVALGSEPGPSLA